MRKRSLFAANLALFANFSLSTVGMLSFQCQVLLFLPGRDRLHSGEIRWSTQPKLWKITFQKPWQPEQEPQSQCQPQSQQFPWPRQRISSLLTSSQPLSLSFLNLSTTDVLPFRCTPSWFLPLMSFPQLSPIDFFLIIIFTSHVLMSMWMNLVCRCTSPFPSPLSFPSSLPFFLFPFLQYK